MAGAGGRTRGLAGLHREAGHEVALHEALDGLLVAVPDGFGVGEGAAQRALDHVPHVLVDRFDPQGVGEDPIRSGGDLLDEVAVSGGGQALGRVAYDVVVRDEAGGAGARAGDLEAVAGDGRAEGGEAVDRGGRAHVHVRATELAGGQLGDVVERARPDRAHDRVLERLNVVAQDFDVLVVAVKRRLSWENIRFLGEFDPCRPEGGDHFLAGRAEGVFVCHDEGLRPREQLGEHFARLAGDAVAEDDVLCLDGRLESLFDEIARHCSILPFRAFRACRANPDICCARPFRLRG